MIKKFKSYFSLSKREFNGITVLIILIIVCFSIPAIYRYFNNTTATVTITELEPAIEKIKRVNFNKYSYNKNREIRAVSLFNFNPNNLPEMQWRELGLSPKQIQIIYNFEAKGGKFYKKEDLKKIYSISASKYQELEPYIVIPEKENSFKKFETYTKTKYAEKPNRPVIDINTADSIALTDISGIGPAFASRIIKYRNRLGGFVNISQLKEVYGIDSLKYEQIKPQITLSNTAIKKININIADFNTLKSFPYLSYKQMNAIINYRKQHGIYRSINDLKNIVILNDQILSKIEPYLQF